jgi:hypothetical protein
MTHRFEVDYKERLKQSREASNAVRLPRLGYELYRVYDIEKPKGIFKGTLNGIYGSGTGGKSSYNMNTLNSRQSGKTQIYGHQLTWAWVDDLAPLFTPAYDVRWLKAKQATMLRLKGHRVEPAESGEKPGWVNPLPVWLGK